MEVIHVDLGDKTGVFSSLWITHFVNLRKVMIYKEKTAISFELFALMIRIVLFCLVVTLLSFFFYLNRILEAYNWKNVMVLRLLS